MDSNKSRLSKNYIDGIKWTLLTFVLVSVVAIGVYPYFSKSPEQSYVAAGDCYCSGAVSGCYELTSLGEVECRFLGCAWYCPTTTTTTTTTPTTTVPTCTSLGVTQPFRQCKCADCDIPKSKLCINDSGYLKQCCTSGLSWAHGGCCYKYYVYCGCSDLATLDDQVLLFCKGADLSQYGNVTFKYQSTDGKCPTNPCID